MTISSTEDLLQGQAVGLRSGVTLHVSYAQGQTPALVFLHGGLGNRLNWRSQYEYFQAQGQTVVAYDLAGHGQSSPYRRYSIGRHCRDLTRLLQTLNIEAPILCCHSYGVPIGLEWAHQNPVSGLLLTGGGTHDLDPWWEIPLMLFFTWGGRHLYQFSWLQRLTNRFTSSHQHDTIQQFFQESPVPTEVHPYRALRIFWGYNFFDRRSYQDMKDVPVLVISAGQDSTFSLEQATHLAHCFPQVKQFHLPNAGHLLMAEYPDQVNSIIADWLQ